MFYFPLAQISSDLYKSVQIYINQFNYLDSIFTIQRNNVALMTVNWIKKTVTDPDKNKARQLLQILRLCPHWREIIADIICSYDDPTHIIAQYIENKYSCWNIVYNYTKWIVFDKLHFTATYLEMFSKNVCLKSPAFLLSEIMHIYNISVA